MAGQKSMKFDREMEETTKKTSMGKLAEKLNAAACCSINAAALVKLKNLRFLLFLRFTIGHKFDLITEITNTELKKSAILILTGA